MVADLDYLDEFLARVDPYLSHWSSLKFACIAARVDSDWVQVAGKATLSTEACNSAPDFKRIADLEDFRAYEAFLEPKAIHRLISNLKQSMVISGFDDDVVRLAQAGGQPYSWQKPYIERKVSGGKSPGRWMSVWSMHGNAYSSGTFPPGDLWRDIDTRLLYHVPPYYGLSDLCARLGLQFVPYTTTSPFFNLRADLPAQFLAYDIDRTRRHLAVTMAYTGTPELVVEWLPERLPRREPLPPGKTHIAAQYQVNFPIPPGATAVNGTLLTMGWDADAFSLRVGWENILLRISEFFDCDAAKLSKFLFEEINLKNVNPFELGIARLLGTAGYTVLWFGKGAKDSLPDLVAYVRFPLGTERVIFGECTLKNPMEKFSDLSKRADALRGFLGFGPRDVLPVVFVRNEATDQDRQAAAEMGLVVCDGRGIRQVQDKIQGDASPDEVFHFLRSLGNLDLHLAGPSALFGSI